MKKILQIFLSFAPLFVAAQQIELFQEFNGRYDFTAFGNTLNEMPNFGTGYCDFLPESSANLTLLPTQTFLSAHLYWAGPGDADNNIELNGIPVSAQRTFSLTANTGLDYFAAYADVSNIISTGGNGTYTFSELDLSGAVFPGSPYCGNTNFGGWAIYVIYEDPTLSLNQIKLFDGLDYVSSGQTSLEIILDGIDVATDQFAKIGFLAWEGEAELANNETLLINGVLIENPPLNPNDNAFNGTNSWTNSDVLYNMDLDFYDLEGIVLPGVTVITINLTSNQDFVMVNNVITSVNSEIPDATIEIDNIGVLCQNNDIDVTYTVYNVNSTAPLPPNTPIAFYADAVLIGQTQTVTDIPIGGSETGVITLNIPIGTPVLFDLIAVVDDIGDGTGVVAETNELNNDFVLPIDLEQAGLNLGPNIESCIGMTVTLDTGITDPAFTFQWFLAGVPIPGETNATLDVTTDGVYSVEAIEGICFVEGSIEVHFNPQPVANPPMDMFQCDDGVQTGFFDLTENDDDILGAQDPTMFVIKYYQTLLDSQSDTNAIPAPTVHQINPPSPQTIFVRIEDNSGTCFDLEQFEIYFTKADAGAVASPFVMCDQDEDGFESINLPSEFDVFVLNGEPASQYNITYHISQADADAGVNALPVPYLVSAPGELIYIRLENLDDISCYDTTQIIDVVVDSPPVINTPQPLIVCDGNNDGFAEFTLHDADADITGADPNLIVTYHPTLSDAQNDLNELIDPYINDDPFNDVVFVRVESTTNSCYNTTILTLEVRNTPEIVTPEEALRVCDYDNSGDGLEFFDLTVVAPDVLGGLDPLLYDLYYYEQESDAITAGDLALTAPDFSLAIGTPGMYQNVVPFTQVIYILVVGNTANTDPNNGGSGCYAIVALTLMVDPLPEAIQPVPYELCDDDLNGSTFTDQISTFNLTTREDEITDGDSTLVVSWYETPGDELADTPILNPEAYQNRAIPPAPLNPQTIVARVTGPFGCKVTVTLTLVVNPVPTSMTPDALVVCDDDNDGFADFTLHDADGDITGGDADLTVSYHPTLLDARNDVNELMDPYENDDPYNDVVFARVESISTLCVNYITLELEVRDSPQIVGDTQDLHRCDVNNPGDGVEFFDLTESQADVLNGLDASLYDIYYYVLESDAITAGDLALTAPDFSLAINNPTMYQNTTPFSQDVYVLVVGNSSNTAPNNGAIGCYGLVSLTLVVDPLPLAIQPQPYELCDDDLNGSTLTDQISTFDLTTREGEITGSDPLLSVTWYETPGDELADTPILNPEAYQNRAIPPAPINPQTIIARVSSGVGCKVLVTLTLVVNPNPSAVTPTPLVVCDDDNNGFALFTLEDKDIEIIGGEPNVGVQYFLTQTLARAGDSTTALVSPYANVEANLQTVWARVTNALTGCYSIVPLDLVVGALPDAPVVPGFGDLLACDNAGGGSAVFNLEDNTPFVYGVQDPLEFSISYHTSLADADAGINPIGSTTAFNSTGQTIWVRLEDNDSGCARVSSFDLVVGGFPVIASPSDMEVCDDATGGSSTDGIATFDLTLNDDFITLGDEALSVFYYETQAQQASGDFIDPASAYVNLTNGQTLFVSVFNQEGCEAQTTLTLFVNPNPTAATPTPLEQCDINNDGFGLFDLSSKDAEIIAGQSGVSVAYYESLADAQNEVFAIVGLYANIVANVQTVYARASFEAPPAATGCATIVALDLVLLPTPLVPVVIDDLEICDDDGFGLFDLTLREAVIFGSQGMDDYTLSYHVTLVGAEAGTNAIANPEGYTNTQTPEQTIYVRLEDNVSGCYKTGEFIIKVSLGPLVNQPDPLSVCDDLGLPNDGITQFDLSVKDDEITGGVPGVEVRYYLTQQDAVDGVNPLPIAYTNVSNPQTIYVRVEDGNTECADTSVSLTLRVIANPVPVVPTAIEACDNNNPGDGIEEFDLTLREAEILNGATWDLGYYEDYADAVTLTNEILTPTLYSNVNSPITQTIYVRVTGDINNLESCFEIVELVLIVNPLPDDTAVVTPYVLCEIGSDGIGIFDLTTKVEEILGSQDPLEFSVSFYHSSADAALALNPIVNTTAYQNTMTPEIIYTGIENNQTQCYIGGTQLFELQVLEGATATAPALPYIICDNSDPNDGIADFTLYNVPGDPDPDAQAAALALEILGAQSGDPIYVLEFYETMEGADSGDPNLVLGNVYTNTINPQIIYARVTHSVTGCYEFVPLVLKVEQLPVVTLAESYRLCVDSNGNPIPEEEGELSPPVIDTGLDPSLYNIVWEYPGGTAVGPSIIALEGGTYTVTYTEIATGCDASVSTTVTVSQPPVTYEAILVNGAFAENHVVQATATGEGTYVYQLDDGVFIESGLFENVSAGTHTVTFKDANGCGSVTLEIGVIDFPKYITPNEDGYHDTWNIIGIAQFDPTAKIYIFDRFGKLLKQISPLGDGWNGTYNGNPLPSSDYWFVVEYTEQEVQKEFKGHFTLKR